MLDNVNLAIYRANCLCSEKKLGHVFIVVFVKDFKLVPTKQLGGVRKSWIIGYK